MTTTNFFIFSAYAIGMVVGIFIGIDIGKGS